MCTGQDIKLIFTAYVRNVLSVRDTNSLIKRLDIHLNIILQVSTITRVFFKNQYILVVSNYFIQLVEAYPMPIQETVTIANVSVNEFICKFGVPLLLYSGQGSQFESSLFQELFSFLDIDKTRTSAYHLQSMDQLRGLT